MDGSFNQIVLAADGFRIGVEEKESNLIHRITEQGEVMLCFGGDELHSGLSCKRSCFVVLWACALEV